MQQNSKFFEIIIKFIKVFWISYFFLKKKNSVANSPESTECIAILSYTNDNDTRYL